MWQIVWMCFQFSQHHLLKRGSFLQCVPVCHCQACRFCLWVLNFVFNLLISNRGCSPGWTFFNVPDFFLGKVLTCELRCLEEVKVSVCQSTWHAVHHIIVKACASSSFGLTELYGSSEWLPLSRRLLNVSVMMLLEPVLLNHVQVLYYTLALNNQELF